MPKSKRSARRVRWDCPTGEHRGVLGSTRPPMDSIVRYCLPCSQEAGKLVKRTAPALDAARERAAARSSVKQATKQERTKAAKRRRRFARCIEPDGSHGEVDVHRTIERMMKLPALRHALADDGRGWLAGFAADFTVEHGSGSGCSGRAWPGSRIYLRVGAGCPRAQVEELVLHELTHYLLPSGIHHGQRFRSTLMGAAREWFPGVRPVWTREASISSSGRAAAVYAMDARIWRDAWELAGGVEGSYPDWDGEG